MAVNTIQVTEPILTSRDRAMLAAAMQIMRAGKEFDTPNGEMPDAVARTVASWYISPKNVVLVAFAQGKEVERYELADAVSQEGRSYGWVPELEYLATWVLNHP